MATVQQMHQALIKQGVSASQLAGLSEEQLMKLCDEKLRASLIGNAQGKFGDGFDRQYKYDKEFTLPTGEKVMVAEVGTSVLKSGRKVQTFVDVAGNQYFQYRSADDKVIDEKYFRKQEKMGLADKFQFMDGKLYKSDMLGNMTVAEKETPKFKPINQQLQEQKMRDDLSKKPLPKEDAVTLSKQLQEKFAAEKDGSLIRKLSSAIDMGNYSAIPTILANDFKNGLDTMDAGVKDIVHKVLFNMGPNQIDAMIRWAVDNNDDANLSLSEKIYNRIADVSTAADNMFVGVQGLVIAAFPLAAGMLPATTAGIVTAGVTAPVIADGIVNTVEGVSDLIDARTEEETSAATQKLATGVLEDAAGIGVARAVIGKGINGRVKFKKAEPTLDEKNVRKKEIEIKSNETEIEYIDLDNCNSQMQYVLRAFGFDKVGLNMLKLKLLKVKAEKGSITKYDVENLLLNIKDKKAGRTALAMCWDSPEIYELYGVTPKRFSYQTSLEKPYRNSKIDENIQAKIKENLINEGIDDSWAAHCANKLNQHNLSLFKELKSQGKIDDVINLFSSEHRPADVQYLRSILKFNIDMNNNYIRGVYVSKLQNNPYIPKLIDILSKNKNLNVTEVHSAIVNLINEGIPVRQIYSCIKNPNTCSMFVKYVEQTKLMEKDSVEALFKIQDYLSQQIKVDSELQLFY